MPHFHISYWAFNAAPWRVFKKVEAGSAREAIERTNPQAAGRYRVTVDGSGETAGLYRVSLRAGCCELLEVTAFDRESVNEPYQGNDKGAGSAAQRSHFRSRRLFR